MQIPALVPDIFVFEMCEICKWLSLRSRWEWVPARSSVPNVSAKSRAGCEKNGEDSSWIPACSKTMLFWMVRSPANYYFHWLRAVTHQSNVNRYFSQGRTSVRRDAQILSRHQPKWRRRKESTEKALNLLNIQREKKEIILKEEQEKAVVELLSGKDVLAILPTGFGKIWSIRSLLWRAQIFDLRRRLC